MEPSSAWATKQAYTTRNSGWVARAHERVAQAPHAGRGDQAQEDEAAEPARVQEHGQIDVVRLLVVVLRHELLRADAEGVLAG